MDYNQLITKLSQLDQQQESYLEVFDQDSANNQSRHFYFNGLFKKKPVMWEVYLFARNKNQSDPLLQSYRLSFIEKNIYQINIYLAIDEIKDRDILMSIIMINQYKNLDLGEHQWNRK
jgi:hypothetical protein